MSSGNPVTNNPIGTYFPGLESEPPPQKVDAAVRDSFLELLKMDDLSKMDLNKVDLKNPLHLLVLQNKMAEKEICLMYGSKCAGIVLNGVQTLMSNQV